MKYSLPFKHVGSEKPPSTSLSPNRTSSFFPSPRSAAAPGRASRRYQRPEPPRDGRMIGGCSQGCSQGCCLERRRSPLRPEEQSCTGDLGKRRGSADLLPIYTWAPHSKFGGSPSPSALTLPSNSNLLFVSVLSEDFVDSKDEHESGRHFTSHIWDISCSLSRPHQCPVPAPRLHRQQCRCGSSSFADTLSPPCQKWGRNRRNRPAWPERGLRPPVPPATGRDGNL